MSGDFIPSKVLTVRIQENGLIRTEPEGFLIGALTQTTSYAGLPENAQSDAGDLAHPHPDRVALARQFVEDAEAVVRPDAGDVETRTFTLEECQSSLSREDMWRGLVACPDCGFAWAKEHSDTAGGNVYSCPNCGEGNLGVKLREAAAREAQYRRALNDAARSLGTIEARMNEASEGDPHEIAYEARYAINALRPTLQAPPSEAAQKVQAIDHLLAVLYTEHQKSCADAGCLICDALRALDGASS